MGTHIVKGIYSHMGTWRDTGTTYAIALCYTFGYMNGQSPKHRKMETHRDIGTYLPCTYFLVMTTRTWKCMLSHLRKGLPHQGGSSHCLQEPGGVEEERTGDESAWRGSLCLQVTTFVEGTGES